MAHFGSSQQSKSEDELWVDAWLRKIGKSGGSAPGKHVPKRTIPLHVAKHHLRNSVLILSKLQTATEELQKNLHSTPAGEWDRRISEIEGLKNGYTALMSNIDSPETLELLRKSVLNRKKKRARMKRQKEERRRLATQKREEREQLHKDIDQWLLNMKEAVERTKMVNAWSKIKGVGELTKCFRKKK